MSTALDDVLRIFENTSNLVNQWKMKEVSTALAERRYYNSAKGQADLLKLEDEKQEYITKQGSLTYAYQNRETVKQQMTAMKAKPEYAEYGQTFDYMIGQMDSPNQRAAAGAVMNGMKLMGSLRAEEDKRNKEREDFESRQQMETDFNVEQAERIAPIEERKAQNISDITQTRQENIARLNDELQAKRSQFRMQYYDTDETGNQLPPDKRGVYVIDLRTREKWYTGKQTVRTMDEMEQLLRDAMREFKDGNQQGEVPTPQVIQPNVPVQAKPKFPVWK